MLWFSTTAYSISQSRWPSRTLHTKSSRRSQPHLRAFARSVLLRILYLSIWFNVIIGRWRLKLTFFWPIGKIYVHQIQWNMSGCRFGMAATQALKKVCKSKIDISWSLADNFFSMACHHPEPGVQACLADDPKSITEDHRQWANALILSQPTKLVLQYVTIFWTVMSGCSSLGFVQTFVFCEFTFANLRN